MSEIKLRVNDFSLNYLPKNKGEKAFLALSHISMDIPCNHVISIIGPSHSGKTSLLRAINRLVEFQKNVQITGDILIDNVSIYAKNLDLFTLRRRIGMVFARPVVLPKTVYENICYGPRIKGIKDQKELDAIVEDSLASAYLWDEVKDRLQTPALSLSGGQQQRLCIARALALRPEIILLDEPTSALDPISTAKIEDTLAELKEKYTVILVTNNNKQAARVGNKTAFFLMGQMIEYGDTKQIFTSPQQKKTEDYITGRFG